MTQSAKHSRAVLARYAASLSIQSKADQEEVLSRAIESNTIADEESLILCRDLIEHFEEHPEKARILLDSMRQT